MAWPACFHAAGVAFHEITGANYPHRKIIPVVAVFQVEYDRAFATAIDYFALVVCPVGIVGYLHMVIILVAPIGEF